MTERAVRVVVNGQRHTMAVSAERRLLDLLRDDLHLTGTKEGCSIGVCGVCTVIVDGEVMSACLVPAVSVDGAEVETVESLVSTDDELSPLQDAFIVHGGYQCGICTPGQLMAATALLRAIPHPTEAEIREWMMGNLCRCTGYEGIVRAIVAASDSAVA